MSVVLFKILAIVVVEEELFNVAHEGNAAL